MELHILTLVISVIALTISARWIIDGITNVATYLKWREFVLAFFVVAIGSALTNLAVGVSAALQGVPELSFGDVLGNNVIIFTVVIASAVFFGKELAIESRVVQKSSLFAALAALLPLLLILDGTLGRGDAIALIAIFLLYNAWLLSKRRLFLGQEEATEEQNTIPAGRRFLIFIKNIALVFLGIAMLTVSAIGIVEAATFFSLEFGIPLVIIGIVIVGFLTSLPELYFATMAARRGNNWIAIGEVLGEVTVLSTLVLGIVALINPIHIADFSPFLIARFFLILAVFLFLIFIRTHRKISRPEAAVLLLVYLLFLATQLYVATTNGYDPMLDP